MPFLRPWDLLIVLAVFAMRFGLINFAGMMTVCDIALLVSAWQWRFSLGRFIAGVAAAMFVIDALMRST